MNIVIWIIVIAAGVAAFYSIRKTRRKYLFQTPPSKFEIHFIEEVEELSDKLEASLDPDYIESVRERVAEQTLLLPNEWDWRYLELKRYFIMCSLLKKVPMFSEEVDDVWHEMIMFTHKYEDFTSTYYEQFLHHEPNITKRRNPDSRGFFDWVYGILFPIYKESEKLYGKFYRYPVHPDIIIEFQLDSDDELKKRYFTSYPFSQEAVGHLIQVMKEQALQLQDASKADVMKKRSSIEAGVDPIMLLFLYESFTNYDHFNSHHTSYDSSCSSGDFHSSGDHSSCSSCSSCGGGGD